MKESFSILFLAAGGPGDFKLSGKFRVYNYVAYLRRRNCRVTVIAWNRHYKDLASTIRVLAKRRMLRWDSFLKLLKLAGFMALLPFHDVAVIQRSRFPAWLLGSMRFLNSRLVFDFDDALFAPFPGLGLSEWSQENARTIADRFDAMLPYFALVVAGNSHLADHVRPRNDRVIVIPTPVDTITFSPRIVGPANDRFTIGWVGAGEQHLEHLRLMIEPLLRLGSRHNIRVRIIGVMGSEAIHALFAPHPSLHYAPADFIPEGELIDEIQRFDVGVMPLRDSAWSRGKCGYKALLYMACGVPAVASAVGVNRDIISHGINGFLATTAEEWTEALESLIASPATCLQMGREGRKTIEQRFSQKVCEEELYVAFRKLQN